MISTKNKDMLNHVVRPWLILLLGWKIGYDTNFTVSSWQLRSRKINYLHFGGKDVR